MGPPLDQEGSGSAYYTTTVAYLPLATTTEARQAGKVVRGYTPVYKNDHDQGTQKADRRARPMAFEADDQAAGVGAVSTRFVLLVLTASCLVLSGDARTCDHMIWTTK